MNPRASLLVESTFHTAASVARALHFRVTVVLDVLDAAIVALDSARDDLRRRATK